MRRRWKHKIECFRNWKKWSNLTKLELKEAEIWDFVSEERANPVNACEITNLAKNETKPVFIWKSDISKAFFLQVKNDDNSPTIKKMLKEVSSQVEHNIVYVILSKEVQYPTVKKLLEFPKNQSSILVLKRWTISSTSYSSGWKKGTIYATMPN